MELMQSGATIVMDAGASNWLLDIVQVLIGVLAGLSGTVVTLKLQKSEKKADQLQAKREELSLRLYDLALWCAKAHEEAKSKDTFDIELPELGLLYVGLAHHFPQLRNTWEAANAALIQFMNAYAEINKSKASLAVFESREVHSHPSLAEMQAIRTSISNLQQNITPLFRTALAEIAKLGEAFIPTK